MAKRKRFGGLLDEPIIRRALIGDEEEIHRIQLKRFDMLPAYYGIPDDHPLKDRMLAFRIACETLPCMQVEYPKRRSRLVKWTYERRGQLLADVNAIRKDKTSYSLSQAIKAVINQDKQRARHDASYKRRYAEYDGKKTASLEQRYFESKRQGPRVSLETLQLFQLGAAAFKKDYG